MSPAIADEAHATPAAIITRRNVLISWFLDDRVGARESNSRPCAGHEPHDGHCRAVRIGAFGSRYSEISTVPTHGGDEPDLLSVIAMVIGQYVNQMGLLGLW
jgi:hypothetical protein